MPNWVSKYTDFNGQEEFKSTIANLMEKYWVKKEVKTSEIAM